MTDVNRLFSTLQDLSDSLNRESDNLTAEIAEFESRLVELRLGISLWYHEPVRETTPQTEDDDSRPTATYLVFAKGKGGWGLYLRSCFVGEDPEKFFEETKLRDAVREDRVAAVKLFSGFLEGMVDAARARIELVRHGRDEAQRVNAGDVDRTMAPDDAAKGAAMLAVILDVWNGGKDLINNWKLKQSAEDALAKGGVEGLRRYYEDCLTSKGKGVYVRLTLERNGRKTLESEYARFMSICRGN